MKAPRYRDLKVIIYKLDEVTPSKDDRDSFICPCCGQDACNTMPDYMYFGKNLRSEDAELPNYENCATICLCSYCQHLFAVDHRYSWEDETGEDLKK